MIQVWELREYLDNFHELDQVAIEVDGAPRLFDHVGVDNTLGQTGPTITINLRST